MIARHAFRLPASASTGAAADARGIRRGCSLANSAGTYEFAREHPATSRASAAAPARRASGRTAACERARKFRRRERAGLPDAVLARSLVSWLEFAR